MDDGGVAIPELQPRIASRSATATAALVSTPITTSTSSRVRSVSTRDLEKDVNKACFPSIRGISIAGFVGRYRPKPHYQCGAGSVDDQA